MKSVRLPRPPAAVSQWISGKGMGDQIIHFVTFVAQSIRLLRKVRTAIV
jgi:hypothetical protein